MKITPIANPSSIPQQGTPESVRTAKAVAAFNKGASSYDKPAEAHQQPTEQMPVQDANNISPEEISAVRAQTQAPETTQTLDTPTPVEVEAKEETPAKNPELTKQFAELARQERILRAKAQKQSQELKVREDALKAQEAAVLARSKEYEQGYVSKDRLKSDPLSVLAEADMSYDELT